MKDLSWTISLTSPNSPDSLEIIRQHEAHCADHSVNPAHDYVLDVTALSDPAVAFFGLRDPERVLLAVGALKRLSSTHAELKSMHTLGNARSQGIGTALLEGLLREAESRGFERVSLETGTQDGFAAARRLYVRAGFVECEPFGDYLITADNVYFTRELSAPG
jgi:putative acetyltransferase